MKKFLLGILVLISTSAYSSDEYTFQDKECLAANVYHEARSEPTSGMIAVIMVTLNRVESDRYPNSVCEVVFQGEKDERGLYVRHRCQFSWVCDGISDKVRNTEKYKLIRYYIVKTALRLRSLNKDLTYGSLHYHADYVNPHWADERKLVAKVGRHLFYKGIR